MKKKFIVFLKWIWITAVVVFIALFFYRNNSMIHEFYTVIPLFNISLSFFFLFFAKALLTLFMYYSIICVNKKISYFACFRIYHTSQLAKYIPGNIWHFVSKGAAYKKCGFTLNDIKNAILAENIILIGSAIIFGVCILSIYNYNFLLNVLLKYEISFSIFAVAIFLLVALYFVFMKNRTTLSCQFIKKKVLMKICILQICIWLSLGLNFYLIIYPFTSNPFSALEIIGLFAIAYGIGYIAPFAPAGMGVRESVLVLGLFTYLPHETIITCAVFNRITYIIVELILAASAVIIIKKNSYCHEMTTNQS